MEAFNIKSLHGALEVNVIMRKKGKRKMQRGVKWWIVMQNDKNGKKKEVRKTYINGDKEKQKE